MKYLKIQNQGELDIRLVALMGGTTKANDKFKIGQFGTGLKYTLAFLYRNNLSFKIFSGSQEIAITTEKEDIRGDIFEIICINNQRTSITTKMGEDWTAWMIVRELWCNALDEGGAFKEVVEYTVGEDGKTTFFIQIDKQIQEVLNNWSKYFIHDQTPVFSNGDVAIYPAGDSLCIYKQGVLINERKGEKSVFSYDIKYADINELREFKGSVSQAIVHCLAPCNDIAARYFLENVTEKHFEGGVKMDYNWYTAFGQSWVNVIGSAKLIYKEAIDKIRARGGNPDVDSMIIVPEIVYKALTKQFEGIGALRIASKLGDFYETYSIEMEGKIKQGLVILEASGYPLHPELEFVYGFFEDKTTLAQIHAEEKKIYISNTLLQQPLFTIVAMLIEENEHFATGLSDETRAFQQHFINLYTRTLLKGAEIEI